MRSNKCIATFRTQRARTIAPDGTPEWVTDIETCDLDADHAGMHLATRPDHATDLAWNTSGVILMERATDAV